MNSALFRRLSQQRSLPCLRGHPRIRPLHTTPTVQESQASPLSGYYKLLLDTPLTPANPAPPAGTPHPPASTPPTEPHSPNPPRNEAEQRERENRARVVFGSRLAGPIQREREKHDGGRYVAGVFVPPKPAEPDNCCMSGCVNCVLTQFVEDLDEWKAASREAKRRLDAARASEEDAPALAGDGGLWEGFEDIPVGLRVFMENEKKIRERKGERSA